MSNKNKYQRMGASVLILSNALSGGGAEVVARQMITHIDNSIGLVFENDDGVSVSPRVVYALGHRHGGGIGQTLWINLLRLFRIQKQKFILRPRCTISHLEGPNFANMLTCFGGSRFLFVHNKVSDSYQRRTIRNQIKYALCKLLYKRADAIIAVSQGISDELVSTFGLAPSKIQVQKNPVDIAAIRSSAQENSIAAKIFGQHPYIISVASLTEQKNHLQMLQIFKEYLLNSEQRRGVKLVLAGDGPLRTQLQSACADLGLAAWSQQNSNIQTSKAEVFFLGFQSNPYPVIAKAKALIMTSFWEGLPISLLEAMSLGIPSVVSDSSTAIRELWQLEVSGAETNLDFGKPIETPYGVLMPQTNSQGVDLQGWVSSIDKVLSSEHSAQQKYQKICQERAMVYDVECAALMWRSMVGASA